MLIRVTQALITYRIVSPSSYAIPIQVGINIYTEVDLVDIQLV
jgi:hypothetical protein